MSSPLRRVKTLIWIHSLIGAGLVIAFFAVISRDMLGSVPIVACGVGWFAALHPIERLASTLKPADRVPATGLPSWVLALCVVGQLLSLAVGRVDHPGWLIAGHLFVGGVLLLRGFLSVSMDVPLHARTWTVCMVLLTVGIIRCFCSVLNDMMGV